MPYDQITEEALAKALGIRLKPGEEISAETLAEFTNGKGEDNE